MCGQWGELIGGFAGSGASLAVCLRTAGRVGQWIYGQRAKWSVGLWTAGRDALVCAISYRASVSVIL